MHSIENRALTVSNIENPHAASPQNGDDVNIKNNNNKDFSLKKYSGF